MVCPTSTPLRTTARITALSPGQSPPPVSTPMRTSSYRLLVAPPHLSAHQGGAPGNLSGPQGGPAGRRPWTGAPSSYGDDGRPRGGSPQPARRRGVGGRRD